MYGNDEKSSTNKGRSNRGYHANTFRLRTTCTAVVTTNGLATMYYNPSARAWKSQYKVDPAVLPFHRTLPSYGQSPLHKLPQSFCEKLGVGSILVKDESHRFGLPAYKILGASWGCYRTVTKELGLPLTTSLEKVKEAAQHAKFQYYTATDGNWGRSVARMATILGASAHIYVPKVMIESTRWKIAQEGATVVVVDGDYDQAVKEAERVCTETGGLLMEDTAWPGYEEIPQVSSLTMCSFDTEHVSGSLMDTQQ